MLAFEHVSSSSNIVILPHHSSRAADMLFAKADPLALREILFDES